jgi:dihydroorotate dehydrogenase (fumarate)
MANLETEFLGLKLSNPLVPSSSPLTGDAAMARRLEDAGAAAIVMPSLFEEEVHQSEESVARFLHDQAIGFGEANSFLPIPEERTTPLDEYLELLTLLKASLDIPVIASLNGVTNDGWIRYAKEIAEAGADALELNVYYVAANVEESAAEVESRYVEMLYELRQQVRLPVCMKLSSQFSSIGHFVRSLEAGGAAGAALFNRFYQPDIDLVSREVLPKMDLSSPYESLLRIHWLAILHGRVGLSLAATGGFHGASEILKAIMAGADVVYLCAELLRKGPAELAVILQDIERWLEEHEYDALQQLKGSVSQQHAIDPAAYQRNNYVKLLESYRAPEGVLR